MNVRYRGGQSTMPRLRGHVLLVATLGQNRGLRIGVLFTLVVRWGLQIQALGHGSSMVEGDGSTS